jgi:hypothetical protein
MLSLGDKKGGNPRSSAQLLLGRDTVNDAGLIDLGFEGYPYTWSNGRQDGENVQCRLDRAMGTADFLARFAPIRVTHLSRFGSDHVVVLINLEAPNNFEKKKKQHIFIFEEC